MKHIIPSIGKLGLLGGALLLATGCSKFLDEQDKSHYTQDNYFQTADQAEASINTLYANLRFVSDGSGTYGESPFMMLEFPTGLCNTEVGQSQYNNDLRNLTADAENAYFYNWWRNSYKAIANANLSIARIPAVKMDAARQQELLGEAYFNRAFHYYNLVRMFGKVPLITTPTTDGTSDSIYVKRNTEEEVYNQIVSDLQQAEQAGLPNTDPTGRASLGATKSLLSSVYLTMAGFPLQKGQAYYQKAADKAKEVIDAKWYSLFPEYKSLHDRLVKNTGEQIFQNQYLLGVFNTTLTAWFLPRSQHVSGFSDEYGSIYPTDEFYASFEKNDKRTQEYQFFYSRYSKIVNGVRSKDSLPLGHNYIYKYFDESAVLGTPQSDINWTFMRYAEVLLVYAEAQNAASGPNAAVYAAVDAVRSRAQLPTLEAQGITSQDAVQQAVWKERYHELCFENKTWFDMVRTRKVYNLTTGGFDSFAGHKFTYNGGNSVLSEKYYYFGVPQREKDNNKNLDQNTGWEKK